MSSGVAWVFPGQGSQAVGMGRQIAETWASARQVYADADAALSDDPSMSAPLSTLCWEGPEDELVRTPNQQPAILATSMAYLKAMHDEGLLPEPDYVAGHSLGEYSALVAADAITLEDAVRLVRRRGALMERHGQGGMAAVLGLDEEAVQMVANETGVEVANYNAPGQITLSGQNHALDVAEIAAKARGARRFIRLAVNGAFHSSWMRPVAEELAPHIERTTVIKPRVPLISNVSAEPLVHPDDIRRELVDQICAPVRWTSSVETMVELGVTHCYEVGYGAVLCGLIGRIDRSVSAQAAEKLLVDRLVRSGGRS